MKTHEDFIGEMHIKHPNITIVGTYSGTNNKIEWVCSNCGMHQFSLPQNLLKPEATGLCRKCFNLQLASNRQKTHDQFIQELSAVHPDIMITGTFQGNNRKIEWVCSNCGKKQLSLPCNLLKPTKTPFCRECALKQKSSRMIKQSDGTAYPISELNSQKFYDAVNKCPHPPILLGEYRGTREKIRFKCSVCGYKWSARPNDFLNSKHACPKCADKSHTIKNDEFIERLSKINPYVIPLEEYKRQDRHIKCKCSRCGYEWLVTPGALLAGNGCPSCCHTGTSYFEQFLLLSLKEVFGDDSVLSRDRKAIGSELDIYIPDQGLAFEYGSWFYHKKRITNDLKKVEKCKQNGIRLIRIYDSCGIENITGKDVFSYPKSIALDISDSIEVVRRLLSAVNIVETIKDTTFLEISNKAYLLSRKMTTAEFKEQIALVQPSVEVIGEYRSNSSRIECKCKVCGYTWNPTAHGLLAGYGCSNCFHQSQKKEEAQFVEEMLTVNPNLELLEPHIASNKRILVRCKVCGRQWKPFASNLLHGYGCSNCKKEEIRKKAIADILRINPNIEIIGEYQGANKTIKVKCTICGYIWMPIANNLIRNASHCPTCSRKRVNEKLKMSNDEFADRLSAISPTIEPLEEYVGANYRVNVRCKTCGYEWAPKAIDLLSGRGCKKCKNKERADRARRTPEQFVQEMNAVNANIIVRGEYTKASEHIEVECKCCGRKWNPCASSLLAGTGCPSCSKKKK